MKERIDYLLERFETDEITRKEYFELMKFSGSAKHKEAIEYLMDTELVELLASRPETGPADFAGLKNRLASGSEVAPPVMNTGTRSPYNSGRRKKRWSMIGIAATILLLLAAGLWGIKSMPDSNKGQVAAYSGRQYIALPDGSTALLNDGTELTHEPNYGSGTREVTLKGEAYFEVKSDPSRPFIVHTADVNTTVLGTAFNVAAYSGNEEIVITVTEGKVAVGDKKRGVYDALLPDEQLAVNTRTHGFEKKTVNAKMALDWKRNFLVLDGVTMELAAQRIAERFGVPVTIENEGLKNCEVNGTFLNNEGIDHVLELVTIAVQAGYTLEDGKATITGGATCKE